jgi:hypothetical protein
MQDVELGMVKKWRCNFSRPKTNIRHRGGRDVYGLNHL